MRITSQNGFGGIDQRYELQDGLKSAYDICNLVVTDSGSLKKRNEFLLVCSLNETEVSGLWCGSLNGSETVIFVADGNVYRLNAHKIPDEPIKIGEVPQGECLIFDFGGKVYIKSGSYYGKYDGTALEEVEGYIPCVAISCAPSGEGELMDQINLICDKRRQLFSGTGTGIYYHLAEKNIDDVISIKIDGEDYSAQYNVNKEAGTVSFELPPAEGLNNVEIIYSKANSESDRNRIFGCTKLMLFGGNSDGRAFLWGNKDYPNYRFHSDLADGIPSVEYFPVNGFTVIGNSKINCIAQQYDRQLIFTENEAFYSYCELRDDGLGNTFSSFPVYSLNGSKGCLVEIQGCIMDNRPVTLCEDGLNMWESTSVEDEKNAVCFSGPITEFIKNVLDKGSAFDIFDFQANHELYLIAYDSAYIYNYGNGNWYRFTGFFGDNFAVIGKTLYKTNRNLIYALNRNSDANWLSNGTWTSNYITFGQKEGKSDLISVEADMQVKGPVTINFYIQKGNDITQSKSHTFDFKEDENGYTRISFRPNIKRAMPFRIHLGISGIGEACLHGITIKTRDRERSSRHGLL